MAPRFYVDTDFSVDSDIILPTKPAHHASRVLRMRTGDEAVLFNGRGEEASVTMTFTSEATSAHIHAVKVETLEHHVEMTLIQSLVSQEKLDWILEKATELGVDHVIVVTAERCVTKLDEKRLAKRLEQWKNTTISACEQCGRLRFPTVAWMPNLKEAFGQCETAQKIILAPAATLKVRLDQTDSVTFAVGPEGGFSEKEIELAQSFGFECMLLGPRVLRTETAGLVALSVAQWAIGDFQ